MNMLSYTYLITQQPHWIKVVEFYLHVLSFIKYKVTLKHYGQIGTIISFTERLGKLYFKKVF